MKKLKKLSFTPFLLVGLGVIFLLNNFGILPWSIWMNLWKFWPLLLVLIGIEVFWGKSVSWKLLLVAAAAIFLLPIFFSVNLFSNNPLATQKINISQDLGSLAKAKIVVELPATNLEIKDLGSSSTKLVEGSISYSSLAGKPTISMDSAFGQGIFKIKQDFISNSIPFLSSLRNDLKLLLNSQIPLEVLLKTAAAQENIDLRQLRVDHLEIQSQASNIDIELSAVYSAKVVIKTTASNIAIKIPKGVEGQVKINSSVKSVSVPSEYKKEGDLYKTAGFDQAALKAEISIDALAGSVKIQ